MKPNHFENWLRTATCGHTAIYHSGYLPKDRGADGPTTADERRTDAVANAALTAADLGLVTLTQKRIGDFYYEYRAKRTQRRLHA